MKSKGKLKNWLKENGKEVAGTALDFIGENTSIPVISSIIEGIGENLKGDPELSIEKLNEVQSIIDSELEELKLTNEDTANSREMNVKIQESDKASWLSKNTAYLLDLGIVAMFITLLIMYRFGDIDEDQKEIALYGLGALSGALYQVFHFHRGSSQGSKDKTRLLKK